MASNPFLLEAASYAPDMPDYNDPHTDTVLNVIPRTPKSYGPLSMPAPFSSALAKRCQGAIFVLDNTGNTYGFAGDANDLYYMNAGVSPTWTQISKSTGVYNCAANDQWVFALYGGTLIATNIADPPQKILIGVDSKFSDLSAAAPKAHFCATVKSFLVVGNTSDSISGAQSQRVWYSRNGDPTGWDTPGSQLAAQFETGYQDLLGNNGTVQGIVGNLGTADGAVFLQHAIWRMMFAGSPNVFDFFPAEGVRGCIAPGGIAQLGALVYYPGEDGFYAFDGTTSQPIGVNRVDKTFFADLDQSYLGSICSAIDPINKLYMIGYPGSGHSGANCNKLLMYNWAVDRWSTSIPIPAGGFEYLARALSFGYTLDQLYTILGYTIDGLPYPLDSRVWQGGSLLLGIFDTAHKTNFFTGTSLEATIDSSEQQPVPGQLIRINNTRPIVDGGVPSVSIAARNRQVDTTVYGPSVPMGALGTAPQRALGRYVRARTVIPAASSWTHFSGVELEGVPAGVR